ncbi:hypothetical protein QC762_513075 [Podospora pseudocomata]|uniref:Uncharacterized protein n=1 Tax=Podospora pseudocomata TaxID=2093779 RepID=A0ABR0GAU0_9PEZI|nr:hypothetical protein QC762_513075 [Podospora pseudocomata]
MGLLGHTPNGKPAFLNPRIPPQRAIRDRLLRQISHRSAPIRMQTDTRHLSRNPGQDLDNGFALPRQPELAPFELDLSEQNGMPSSVGRGSLENRQAEFDWLTTLVETVDSLQQKGDSLDRLVEKLSKMADDGGLRQGTMDTSMLAMLVANPILQMMRDMDREGCEVTDDMIRQSTAEIRKLAGITGKGFNKVLAQLSKMQDTSVDKSGTLKVTAEEKAEVEAERDLARQRNSRACNHLPSIVFWQPPSSANNSLSHLASNRLWNWNPINFAVFLSPSSTDNYDDLSLVDTAMAEAFFSRVTYRVARHRHHHFLGYSEVRLPCEAEGQGPLIVGRDPPSIANWGAWACVNAMLQGVDEYCCCPEEANYCLRYQVWRIPPGSVGSELNVLKLMWFDIDPLRTGWDVVQAMGKSYWIPVNFVQLFAPARYATQNHPQWCDLSAVEGFFVALVIGNSSGKRDECFRQAEYLLGDAELDGTDSDGVISNHCDTKRTTPSTWDQELRRDGDLDNWRCLNFVLALSQDQAEAHRRTARTRRGQRAPDSWSVELCCCPERTPFCLAIRLDNQRDTSGENYKLVRIKWIMRSDRLYEANRLLQSPVWPIMNREAEERLKVVFQTEVPEECDNCKADQDDEETDEDEDNDEEMRETKQKETMSPLFSESDDDDGEEDQDGSPDTLDFTRAYSPRRSLPRVAGRRPWSGEEEGEDQARNKRRRVDITTEISGLKGIAKTLKLPLP